MFQIFGFYISIIGNIFGIYDSWEMFPGVSYLEFFIAAIIICIILSLIISNAKEDIEDSRRINKYYPRGKHTYQPKHEKK